MNPTLWAPGWAIGTFVVIAIVVAGAPPLLRDAKVRRRVAALTRSGAGRRTRDRSAGTAIRSTGGPSTGGRTRVDGGRRPALRTLIGPAVATALAAAVSPPLAVGVAAAAWVWPRWRATAATRGHQRAVLAELPEVVDLLAVAVASGLNLRLSIEAAGERGPPLLGAALRRAAADVAEGARVADALEAALGPVGDVARPLSSALLGSARYGTPLAAVLDRLAVETRQLRRRQAEEAVRRVPVKLLFPLVLLVLPAFVLLTVVPLLASALRSLPF